MKRLVLITAVLAIFASPVSANLTDDLIVDKLAMARLETPSGQYNAAITLMRMESLGGAAKWLRKAAAQGHAKAQVVLGSLYAVGMGVEQDLVLAMAWVLVGIDSGIDGQMKERSTALLGELATNMSKEELTEARNMAQIWIVNPR